MEGSVAWLERSFEEEEIRDAIFYLGRDKVPGSDGFPMVFLQQFSMVIKADVMAFM